MWNRKKVDNEAEKKIFEAANKPLPPPKTALELLKTKRANKVRLANQLDREIAQLDHDITFVERHPEHARILQFIASRFSEPPATEPREWKIAD